MYRDDREKGAEYLLRHDRRVERRVQQYCGLNVPDPSFVRRYA
jgi:hypothetical protein